MIRTAKGQYINAEHIFSLEISESKLGGYNVTATKQKGDYAYIARFGSEKAAQRFMDALAAALGRVLDVTELRSVGNGKDVPALRENL